MRPFGRILLPWVTQGFPRASDETRTRIAPSFFARESNKGERKRIMRRLARIAIGASLAMSLAGCMSMDEMLASEDGFWRDIGETRAVAFATDDATPLEKRLEVVPKIGNQQKLAQIYLSQSAAPEVKKAARAGITETASFVYIYLNGKDNETKKDALSQIAKDDASCIEGAWELSLASRMKEARALLKQVKDEKSRSQFIAGKVDETIALAAEIQRKSKKYGADMVKQDIKRFDAMLTAVKECVPFVTDADTAKQLLANDEVVATKGTENDLYTPVKAGLDRAKAFAALSSLTENEARNLLLGRGSILKDEMLIKLVEKSVDLDRADGSSAFKVTSKEVLARLSDRALAARLEEDVKKREAEKAKAAAEEAALAVKSKAAFDTLVKAGILKEYDINRCGSADGDPVKKFKLAAEYIGKVSYYEGIESIGKWERSIELFKDDPSLQQKFAEMLFEQIYTDYDDEMKLPKIKKVLAAMPQGKVVEIFKSNITDKKVELKARACAYAITDQGVLKSLLVDDDSWARPRVKNCAAERRRNVYVTLLQNVKDEKLAETIFCETRLTKNTDIICLFDILHNLVGKIGEAKRKELTERAFARSAEAAKATVSIKQYYVGMSCLDYVLINYANGDLSDSGLSAFDDKESRKMIKIGFTKENRVRKLGVIQDNAIAACEQFGSLFGKVPDGKDVSGKTDVVAAIRSKTAYDDNAPGGVSYSSSGVWKWIDYVHNVQAEIENNSGNLVLCEAVVEGTFNDKDVRKEQQNAALGAWADLASDADDKDMGADPGLEPAGK